MDLGADAGKDKDNLDAITWKSITVTLGELKPWADNPKTITKAAARRLLASWKEYGQVQTIAVSPSLQVLDGHQRLNTLLAAYGSDYVIDARQASRELTDDEQKRLVVYLHAGTVGSWDWDALSGWDAPQLMEWGMDSEALQGWKRDIAALGNLLESEKPTADAEPQIDRAAELLEKWQVKPGDLWRIGEHRLLCGDSTKREDVERVMENNRAEMCFTSPPYNAGVSAQLSGNTSIEDNLYKDEYNDNKTQVEYLDLLNGFTELAFAVCDYLFINIQVLSGNKTAFIDYWHGNSDKFADVAIWDKLHAAPAAAQRVMDSRFEFILIFSHKPNRAIGTREFRGMVHNVYAGNPQRHNENADIHAATFPIDLPDHFIKTFTNEYESIFEPFAGTGTTLVACQNLSRRCRAIEISPAYCSVILERMNTAFPDLPIERIEQ